MWIASVENIDWPASPGLSPDRLRADFLGHLDRAQAVGLNAVFVQIRPTADAFWPSRFEPWSQWLTGSQGKDPGWDPLGFMVEAAHGRGLAFHAWFNPYRVSMQPDPARLAADHPARLNPGWAVPYGGRLYYDPGVPAVRRFVQQAMMDAVVRYDIDGVHLDDYFYPYPVQGQDFPDAETFAAHGAGFTDRAAWRRHNVDLLVQELRDLVREARPEAAFGISPFGVWRNARSDPAGSDTTAFESYDGLYADTRAWIRNGWLDYVAPQLYWPIGFAAADYRTLAPWWAAQTEGSDTQLWIGQAVFRVGDPGQPAPWQDQSELSRHLTLNATLPQIGGDILFSAKDVWADRLGGVGRMAADHWRQPALGPVLPRLATAPAPGRPVVRLVLDGRDGPRLTFHSGVGSPPFQYAVYRYASPPGPAPEPAPDRLITIVPAAIGRLTLADASEAACLAVTAVDRANRESPAVRLLG
ncbi:uncharacterized lipoprotein YddW (UPF0748 family) [Kitasatospora sp. GP82]|nr:uncharacterized lipoprotein YddW (UPF0748 family) [Kitasatospora sp. GP82]